MHVAAHTTVYEHLTSYQTILYNWNWDKKNLAENWDLSKKKKIVGHWKWDFCVGISFTAFPSIIHFTVHLYIVPSIAITTDHQNNMMSNRYRNKHLDNESLEDLALAQSE